MLIEGLNYQDQQGSSWLASYPGVSLYAQFLMQQVSEFDLTHNIRADDLGYYAITSRFAPGGTQSSYLLTKYLTTNPQTQDDYSREQFQLYFLQAAPLNVNTAVFKAILSPNGDQVSPQLYSYTIKLGQSPGNYT